MTDISANSAATARRQIHDCWNRIGVRGDRTCIELEQHVHCRNCPVYSAAARSLLEVPLPPDYLASWTSHFAMPLPVVKADTRAVVVFRIATEGLALPARRCVEIVEMRPIHSLPHRRNQTVLGVVNVRGSLLPCISLSAILHTAAEPHAKAEIRTGIDIRRLVVFSQTATVVIQVDEVYGIHRVASAEMQQVPATLAKGNATYTKAVLSLAGRSVGLLDDELLHYTIERSLA
jgi:chemotaxis-related protein WspD